MSLYRIQDTYRPMWIVQKNYQQAIDIWKVIVAQENDMEPEDVDEPLGIEFICGDCDQYQT